MTTQNTTRRFIVTIGSNETRVHMSPRHCQEAADSDMTVEKSASLRGIKKIFGRTASWWGEGSGAFGQVVLPSAPGQYTTLTYRVRLTIEEL